jgi:hypothetical protein
VDARCHGECVGMVGFIGIYCAILIGVQIPLNYQNKLRKMN